jgi:hypothetical protein
MDLSILIPARNEQFLAKTIEDILEHIAGDTEIIAVLDGYRPDPPLVEHPRLRLVYYPDSIGQRAATNQAARLSDAKFIMKCDAHCSFANGFDVALMADCEYDWTLVPHMRNLHAFDWQCRGCGKRTYQGPEPEVCQECGATEFEMVMVWKPRNHTRNYFMRFDSDLHFQYWRAYKKRPEAKGELVETMSLLGACWLMHRNRYWELGMLDERHGSWGQMGTEIACKTWLSGGRLMCSKKTWFAHMFRTQKGFSFPYPNPGVAQARDHSNWLWKGDNWEGAKYPLSWLVDKFAPVPGWHDKKGIVYYTDNRLDEPIMSACQKQLETAHNGHELISVSLEPLEFGRNLTLDAERGYLTMFCQILAGLEASTADIIFLCEHDVLYHASHFEFIPPRADVFYYNENVWKVDVATGRALFHYARQTSGLCAYRELLLKHYRKRVELVERDGFSRNMGFEPGTHRRAGRVDDYGADGWHSEYPNIDIRHAHNLTPSRWKRNQFRNQRYTKGWQEADEVPGWGVTAGRFGELLDGIAQM